MTHARSRTGQRIGAWLLAVGCSILVAAAGSEVSAQSPDMRLVEAVRRLDAEAVSTLLERQVDVNARQADAATALHWAVRVNQPRFSDVLLRAGADVNAIDKFGTTPLMQAAQNGYFEIVDLLLRRGARADATDYSGKSAADFARTNRRLDIVRRLKSAGKS